MLCNFLGTSAPVVKGFDPSTKDPKDQLITLGGAEDRVSSTV